MDNIAYCRSNSSSSFESLGDAAVPYFFGYKKYFIYSEVSESINCKLLVMHTRNENFKNSLLNLLKFVKQTFSILFRLVLNRVE